MDDYTEIFCRNVKYLRLSHHISRQTMAQLLDISVTKLGRMEREQPSVRITVDMLIRVTHFFPVTMDDMMTRLLNPEA